MDNWYYKLFGAEFGPISFDELVELAKSQTISGDDEVRFGEEGVWRRAGSIGQLMTHLPYQAAKKPISSSVNPDGAVAESNAQWSNDDDFETTAEMEAPKIEDRWWCQILGTEMGPMTFEELGDLAKNHTISRDDQVRFGQSGNWRRAGSIGPLMAHFPFQAAERVITTGQKRTGDQIPVMDVPAPTAAPAPNPYVAHQSVQPAVTYAPAQPAVAYAPVQTPAAYVPVPPAVAQAPVVQAPVVQVAAPAPIETAAPAPTASAATPASGAATDELWWCLIDNKEYGPVDLAKIKEWAASGRLHSYDYLRVGLADYVQASEVPGLFPKRPDPASRPSLSAHSIQTKPFERTAAPKPATDMAMSTMSDTAPSMTPAAEQRPYTPPSMSSSASMSTMNNAGGFGGNAGGFGGGSSGAARAPAAFRRPVPSKSSGGGDLSKLLLGPVGMGVGGVVVLGALIYFALPFLTGGNGADITRLQSMQGGLNKISAIRDEGGKPNEIKAAADNLNKLAGKVATELKGTKKPNQVKVLAVAKKIQELTKLDLAKPNPTMEKEIATKFTTARKALGMK